MKNSFDELFDILTDLQNEFLVEEKKLKEISSSHAYRIDELEQQINTARKNEDIDFRVFSPRNLSIDNSNKIKALEDEKLSLEREKSDADKQMGYYTGKADKLTLAVNIVKNYLKSSDVDIIEEKEIELKDTSIESVDESQKLINKNKRNNFSFLYEEEEAESDSSTDEELDKVEELFKKDNSSENDLILKLNDELEDNKKIGCNGIPTDEVERVCHKVEISEKIINNDRVRAKMQLKEVIIELKDLIKAYK